MSLVSANPSANAFRASPILDVGFAEPDWKGDSDFAGLSEAMDLDGWMSDLAAQIEEGARRGWLSAYQARRSGFDLQSIRCQTRSLRSQPQRETRGGELRALLSRVDRLDRLLKAAKATV